jgi:hypothetical protein
VPYSALDYSVDTARTTAQARRRLQSLKMLAEDRDRLEKIDKLYALRLNRSVSLPMVPCCTSLANNADQLKIQVAGRSWRSIQWEEFCLGRSPRSTVPQGLQSLHSVPDPSRL